MELCDAERGVFFFQRYDGCLETLFGRRDQGRRHEMTGRVVALSDHGRVIGLANHAHLSVILQFSEI